MALAEPKTRRWTRAEYYKMAELGWFDDQRVELIEGEVVEMSPQGGTHFQTISLVAGTLRRAFGAGFWIREQGPLALGINSDPEPDVAAAVGSPRDYPDHPTTALLVIEVSDSSLAYHRSRKASLYAKAGIEDYWIVNLIDRYLEICRNPVSDPREPYGSRYDTMTILGIGATASPLALPQAVVAVSDLLP